MSMLEKHLEAIINIFHQYSVRVGHYDTLSNSELKKMITRELANTIKNTQDQSALDKIFQNLDDNEDGEVDFKEFLLLLATVLVTTHKNLHRHE